MASLAKKAAEQAMGIAQAAVAPTNSVWGTTKFQTTGTSAEHWAYSCFCPQCAGASAKTKVDQSSCLFNFLCFPPPATYSMVRYNYGIQGECGDDMLWTIFCFPCMIRQAYTEAQTRGNISGKYGALSDDWHFGLTSCECVEFLTAAIVPCYVANGIRKVIHPTSDTWFNIFCIVPCSMYGTVRHTYGLRSEWPNPVCEDLAVGTVCYPCALTRAAKEAPYQRTTGKVNSAIETAHKKAEEMKSTLQNAKSNAMSKIPGMS